MKIALFTDTFLPQVNGVSNTLNRMIHYFEEHNIEYKLFAPRYEENVLHAHLESFFSIRFIPYPESRIAFPNSYRITSVLDAFQPDLIHIMTEFNLGLAGLNYGKKNGIPTISNYTTNFPQYMEYYKANFLKEPVWNYIRWFHNQNSMTLTPSYTSIDLLKSKGIYRTGLFTRGIDYERFHPDKRNDGLRSGLGLKNKITLLYVGRISYEKELDLLSASYYDIQKKYPGRTQLILTGNGPYMEKCQQLFSCDTIFTGQKTGEELAAIYASADIFICPSSTETFGNVILEAMSSELAVIGADSGGVNEIIEHGVTGLKFNSGDSSDLTAKIEYLITHPDICASLGKKARSYAATRSWNKIFEDLLSVYEKLILCKNSQNKSA